MTDDLSAPLGGSEKRERSKLKDLLPMIVAGLLGLSLATFVVWAMVVEDPSGGEPVVVVPIDQHVAAKKPDEAAPKVEQKQAPAETKAEPAETPKGGSPSGMQTVTIINGASGERQEVQVPAQSGSQQLALADPKLLDMTRHGPVPRVSSDGARPFVVYARKVDAAKANLPRIALVVTGLGVSAGTTAEAMAKLPPAVSFAFAPYATDVERVAARAHAEGHELLLQLPMEPFDYPDNDPGPQTLLISLAPEQNIDRMYWLMSRFQAYVGVASYMGSRFTANDAALAPVLREIAKRGLMYLDDGSSPRSLAGQIAGANSLPFAKANVLVDTVPTPDEIDRALARLESLARDNGIAVGVATALPVSVARIANWAKTVEARGFVLVPISAAATKPKTG
jgi:polysaccharide deacetylase 2 family uncharacterized protein YibQ